MLCACFLPSPNVTPEFYSCIQLLSWCLRDSSNLYKTELPFTFPHLLSSWISPISVSSTPVQFASEEAFGGMLDCPFSLTFISNSPKLLTIHYNTPRIQILLNTPIAPTLFQSPRVVFVTVYKFVFLLLLYFSNKLDLAEWTLLNSNHVMLFLSSKPSNSLPGPQSEFQHMSQDIQGANWYFL